MIYPITLYGDSVLREECKKIIKGEVDVINLSNDMFETMSQADGIGLAAPQIGISKRIFVVDGTTLEDKEMSSFKKVFINPVILGEDGDEWEFEEGCLSIPGVRGGVFRKSDILIRYFDENWNEIEESYSGMKARIIQHEYDHIEGILFTDKLSALRKQIIKSKLKNISKGNIEVDYSMKFPK